MPWFRRLDSNQRNWFMRPRRSLSLTPGYIVPVSFNSVAPTESLLLRPHLFLRGLSPQATYRLKPRGRVIVSGS